MYREEILKEQFFRSINISIDERDFLLSLLGMCKDINDSEYGDKTGKIVELSMEKDEKSLIHISGSVAYKTENRTIEGDILYYKDSIVFKTKMTRLCCKDDSKEYLVLDIFSPTENGYELISHYDCDTKEYKREIDMKGKVK